MTTLIKQIPTKIEKEIRVYKPYLSKPQYKHFKSLICGLIVSDNKTIQEISSCTGTKDQSSLNRFLGANWDRREINRIRLRKTARRAKEGFVIIDDTLAHKTGKKIEYTNYHYDNLSKKKEYGHSIVTSFFSSNISFPIDFGIYVRKVDCRKLQFNTKREFALTQIDVAIENKLKVWAVLFDCWYFSTDFIKELKQRRQKHVCAIKSNKKISINRGKRIAVSEYVTKLKRKDFRRVEIEGKVYFYHVVDVSIRGVGKERLVISRQKRNKEFKYIISDLDWSGESILIAYFKRNTIETFHRDAKQHLGLEDYQLRSFSKIHSVVLAVFVAYTLLILSRQSISMFGRMLQTIGEVCRYLKLIAIKGWRWLKKTAKDLNLFKVVLNRYVFVKNAKV